MQADCVAVMQPYFVPYAGYFRLIAASDLFVIYDCVQFPRRGWVHRNQLPDRNGMPRWLTLPLAKAPQDVLIEQLEFAERAGERLSAELRRFPSLDSNRTGTALIDAVRTISGRPVDYLVRLLELACEELGIEFRAIRSSSLDIPRELKASDRMIEITRRLGAKTYLNASGGRELYDPSEFERAGVALRFLTEYRASRFSVLHRLATESPEGIAREIRAEIRVEN